MNDFFLNIIVSIAALIVAFALLREAVTWYWKQNEIVDLLKEQNRLLRILVNNSELNSEQTDDEESNESGETSEVEEKKKSFMEKVKDAEDELKHKK